MMQYFSTNRKSAHVSFREATLNGQPEDKGLYFPERVPQVSWADLREKSKPQIAFEVIKPYVGDSIADEMLFQICAETVNFDFPLIKITENIATLELFHGATLAFKDVGARFMSRCLQYFSRGKSEKTIVIVATSGDTGGAVANGFYDVEGVEVVILYPKGKVSKVQELQLTTLGKNISALEVAGNFDDCQTLAKTALAGRKSKTKSVSDIGKFHQCRPLASATILLFLCSATVANPQSAIRNPQSRNLRSKRKFRKYLCGNFGAYFGFAVRKIYRGLQCK